MLIIDENECKVLVYDSIEELPANQHNEFNITILEDENIGSSIESIERHNRQILDFLMMQNAEYALEQAKNQNFCIQNVKANYDLKKVAFCHLVHSINGIEPVSRNVDFLSKLIDKISIETIYTAVDEVKKKLIAN